MPDYFVLFDEPRRPWIDPASLKAKFLTLSAEVHPDRVHNLGPDERQKAHDRYIHLNSAYNCLREPRDRLRHLIELESGVRPKEVQIVPTNLMDLLAEVSRICREADALLAEKSAVTSPLLKVQFFERSQSCTEKLMALQQQINSWREKLEAELKQLDARWIAKASQSQQEREADMQRLEDLYRLLGYFMKASGQIQERISQLSL